MKKLTLIILLIASIAVCRAQNTTAADQQAMAMLKNFYTAYMTEVAVGSSHNFVKKLTTIQKKYCTPALVEQIPALIERTDCDPFLKAQDSNVENIKSLSFKKDARAVNLFIVSYTDIYRHNKTTIKLTVVKQKDNFKIASVF
jgi:hypothetical protein